MRTINCLTLWMLICPLLPLFASLPAGLFFYSGFGQVLVRVCSAFTLVRVWFWSGCTLLGMTTRKQLGRDELHFTKRSQRLRRFSWQIQRKAKPEWRRVPSLSPGVAFVYQRKDGIILACQVNRPFLGYRMEKVWVPAGRQN